MYLLMMWWWSNGAVDYYCIVYNNCVCLSVQRNSICPKTGRKRKLHIDDVIHCVARNHCSMSKLIESYQWSPWNTKCTTAHTRQETLELLSDWRYIGIKWIPIWCMCYAHSIYRMFGKTSNNYTLQTYNDAPSYYRTYSNESCLSICISFSHNILYNVIQKSFHGLDLIPMHL